MRIGKSQIRRRIRGNRGYRAGLPQDQTGAPRIRSESKFSHLGRLPEFSVAGVGQNRSNLDLKIFRPE